LNCIQESKKMNTDTSNRDEKDFSERKKKLYKHAYAEESSGSEDEKGSREVKAC
jgi:hypothetical protein